MIDYHKVPCRGQKQQSKQDQDQIHIVIGTITLMHMHTSINTHSLTHSTPHILSLKKLDRILRPEMRKKLPLGGQPLPLFGCVQLYSYVYLLGV